MRTLALVSTSAWLVNHALGACTGMNAADKGSCPVSQCLSLVESFSKSSALISAAAAASSSSISSSSFVSEQSPDHASITTDGLSLSLVKSSSGYEGSTVYFTDWIQYGTITARILSGSTTPGVVSSLQLQDDSGSVIDMDWVGASPEAVQANYYVSNQVELSQAVAQALPNDPTNSFITYKIIWTPDSLTWYANGLAIRTVSREDTWAEGEQQFKYPSSPSRLSFSIWDAANSINPGETQEWAGRIPDNSTTTQFTMAIGMVSIQCYSNTTNTDSNSNSGTAASATQNMSNFVSSKPVVNVDLSNFGLASGVSSSPSPSSSLTSSTGAADNNELSQWLADMSMTSSGAWLAQTLGIATSVLFTFGVAIISHI